MASILDRYGIKEVADVTFYDINDDGTVGKPVLVLDSLKVTYDAVTKLIKDKKVYSAYTVKDGGALEAIYKMAFGNEIGVKIIIQHEDIFNAMHFTPLSAVKVVLLGQDPYHNVNQAIGASFAVPPGQEIPPSLVNIYKELQVGFSLVVCD